LRAYLRKTKDEAVQNSPAVQKGIRLVLKLILRDGFDMFPTLLVSRALQRVPSLKKRGHRCVVSPEACFRIRAL
jgi:hypothetical protein